jgi:UPF0716 protein FxsA
MILLGFLALPFVEIAVFIRVGEHIGVWPVIGLTVLSTMVGLSLMRHQGLATLARARQAAERNEPPVDEMLDGLCILLAGLCLMVPGFVTDIFGLLLFVPWVRRHVRRWVWRGLERQGRHPGTVIETEYVVVEEKRPAGDEKSDDRREPPRLGDGNGGHR